jgi:hypothetical protein
VDYTLCLTRYWLTDRSTTGILVTPVGTNFFTLEDPRRPNGVKVPGATCIPAGRYGVVMAWSDRFKRSMPRLLDVPGFDGIEIHGGNTPADTAGCILVGLHLGDDRVDSSRMVFEPFVAELVGAIAKHDVFIEIGERALRDVRTAEVLAHV